MHELKNFSVNDDNEHTVLINKPQNRQCFGILLIISLLCNLFCVLFIAVILIGGFVPTFRGVFNLNNISKTNQELSSIFSTTGPNNTVLIVNATKLVMTSNKYEDVVHSSNDQEYHKTIEVDYLFILQNATAPKITTDSLTTHEINAADGNITVNNLVVNDAQVSGVLLGNNVTSIDTTVQSTLLL